MLLENFISTDDDFPNSMKLCKNYLVSDYDDNCEEHLKIKEIVPVKKSKLKLLLFIILNFITLLLINLIISWFPNLKIKLLFQRTSIIKADYVVIYGNDDSVTITPLLKEKIPNILDSILMKYYSTNIPSTNILFIFSYKLFNYVFIPSKCAFASIKTTLKATCEQIHTSCSVGLSPQEVLFQRTLYGECDLNINIDSFFKLLFDEFTDPFYIFQVLSVILWYYNEYYSYATLIVIATLISLFVGTFETKENLESLREMAKYSCEVQIFRENEEGKKLFVSMDSKELVPGDLFEVPDGSLPCDAILLEGHVVVNESMLTGESVPVTKTKLSLSYTPFDSSKESNHILYAGTKTIIKKPNLSSTSNKVLAIALETGFNSVKGNLIRPILFPKQINFKFKSDSVKYIIIMAFLSVAGFGVSVPFLIEAGLSVREIVIKFLDLITTAVPPSLPACLGIGVTYAISRLKSYGIICINRDRVNIAGKTNMIVFDKTGTLTEDYLDIHGFIPIKVFGGLHIFDVFTRSINSYKETAVDYVKQHSKIRDKAKEITVMFCECLGTCHTATVVNNEIIGDTIDVKMFMNSKWEFVDNDNFDVFRPKGESSCVPDEMAVDDIFTNTYQVTVTRRFEFSSSLQRMSVIVKNVNEPYFKIYCKGSPEKIKDLCKDGTIPNNFNSVLTKYTSLGFRVLGLAGKLVKMTYLQSEQMAREQAESNLIFLGLIIVQNKLKKETASSVSMLNKAGIRMVMATGDNILTGISVSKECGLISKDAIVHYCNIENGQLSWNTIENYEGTNISPDYVMRKHSTYEEMIIDGYDTSNESLEPEIFTNEQIRISEGKVHQEKKHLDKEKKNEDLDICIDIQHHPFANVQIEDLVIAITGPTFSTLMKMNQEYLNTNSKDLEKYHTVCNKILHHCYIFARMSPDDKALLVTSLKKEKLTVLMCGDGANDCAALRASDIGVSLSPEEASIASHFTSKITNISCLIKLLREGKASLVTSIQTFKYMMIYSLIQFISVTLLMIEHSYLSDHQFLATDIFIIFPLAFFIAKTGAYEKLTHHRPTDSLISFPIIFSILVQTGISFIFQYGSWFYLSKRRWYVNECADADEGLTTCQDNTVIYLVSNMQYLITAFGFSIAKPFRKPIYSNIQLTLFMIFSFIYSCYIILCPDQFSVDYLQLYDFNLHDKSFKFYVFGFTLGNFIVSYMAEKILVPRMSTIIGRRRLESLRQKIRTSRGSADGLSYARSSSQS